MRVPLIVSLNRYLRSGFYAAALLVAAEATSPRALPGQHPARATPPANAPAREATQFDFLVGQWELEVTPRVSSLAARIHGAPKLLGSWKAWKALDGFGIEDELRIMDRSGNPSALSLAVRVWNASERRWLVTSTDAYRARVSQAAAQWDGKVMSQLGNADGGLVRTRSRFSAITPTAFRFEQDRSEDGGKTWEERSLVIQAKRVAGVAPR
jgi:hypothetical protein